MELRPEEEYTLLYNIETKLRMIIEAELSAISDYWWQECIPWKTRELVAERIKREELAPWFRVGGVKLSEVYYLGVEDYAKIITHSNNWKRAFEKIFHEQHFIRDRLKVLKVIRNKVMHFQPLKPKEKHLLEKYVEEILTRIGDWETINSRYVDTAREALLKRQTSEGLRILKNGLKQTVTEENPRGDPWVAFWMGWAFEEMRKYDEAESWYRYAGERLLPRYKKMAEERLLEIAKKKTETVEVICPNCGHRFKTAGTTVSQII